MAELKIEYKKLNELEPYKNNPRLNDGAVDKVADSIKEFGFKNPIIVDADNVIIAGHTRLKAAKQLGLDTVPVIKVEDLTDEQVRAFRIADNKTAEFAEWDFALLQEELEKLEIAGHDLSLDMYDFEKEIDKHNRAKERAKNDPTAIEKAKELIIEDEIIEILRKEKVYFSFSGGQDSATTIYMVAPILEELGIDFELILVDTGVELPGVEEYCIKFAEHFGYPFKVLRSGKTFFEYYEDKKAFPNAIYRDCIMVLIGEPINKYIESQIGEGQKGVNVRGGRNNQATDLSKGKKFYEHEGVYIFNALWDLEEEVFEKYKAKLVEEFGLWEGYERGFVRTACWCCPFQTVQQFDKIREDLPLCWDILERKAKEWQFWGSTHLDRYIKNHIES